MPIRAPWLVLLLPALLCACSEIAPTNPYDPGTPAAQQAKALVRGAVALPPGYAPERFTGAGVSLHDASDAGEPVMQVGLTAEAAPEGSAVTAPFTFEGVPAGRYTVRVRLEGFAVAPVSFEAHIAERVDLGTLAASVAGTSAIEGQATLEPAPPEGHGGITVEIAGAPGAAQTSSTGAWRLAVGAGTYTLAFNAPGYERAELADQRVEEGQVLMAPPVVLHGRPGGIQGLVTLDPLLGGPELLGLVSVRLRTLDVEGGADVPPVTPTTTPENPLRGTFAFDGLAPGNYLVEAILPDLASTAEAATVRLGERANAGDLVLTASLADKGGTLTGVVRRGCPGGCDHGGIRVEAVGKGVVTVTDAEGGFRLALLQGSYDLAFSADGYSGRTEGPFAVEEKKVAIVSTVDAPFVLDFLPAAVTGRVVRGTPDGELVPAAGAALSLAGEGGPVGQTAADARGEFRLDGFPGGNFVLTASLPGHATVTREVLALNGRTSPTGELILAPERGTIAGTVVLAGAEGRGGASIRVVRRRGPDDEPVVRSALTAPPDDTFRLAGLPTGTYDLVALAEGFRPVERTGLVVAVDATVVVEEALARRVHTLSAPAGSAVTPVTVTFAGDPDLTYVRVWREGATAPEGLDFEPLPADGRVPVPLPAEGSHVLRAELATAAYVRPEPETAHLRALSPTLSATVVLDTRAPTLAVAHAPTGGALPGFLRLGDVAAFDLAAFDPLPGSGVAAIRLSQNAGAPVEQPFAPRLGLPALPAGGHALAFVPVDAAGNAGSAAAAQLLVDAAAPVGLLTADQPLRTREGAVFVRVQGNDADGAPLEYRLFEAGQPGGAFRPFPPGDEAVEVLPLRPGDGDRTLSGEVRDAAGRVTPLNEVTFTVDTHAAAPTGLVVTDAAGAPIQPGGRVRLTPGPDGQFTINVEVQVDGADEPLTARLQQGAATCPIDPRQRTSCTLSGVPLDAVAGNVQTLRLSATTEDEAGNTSEPLTFGFTVDLDAPRELGLELLGGKDTNELEVDVRLTASGASAYAIGGAGVQAVPETPANFPVQRRLVLTAGDGPKPITATFRDEAGNVAQLETSVRLDRTPPRFSVSLLRNGAPLNGDPPRISEPFVTVRLDPIREGDCPALNDCRLEKRVSLAADFGDTSFAPFTQDTALALPPEDGLYPVYVEMRDPAGNVAQAQAQIALRVALDQRAPAIPGLRRTFTGRDKIRLELTPPGDDDIAYFAVERNLPEQDASWHRVALYPAVADDLAPVETGLCPVQQARCGDAADCLRPGPAGAAVLLEDRAVVPGIAHVYRVQAVDTLGNASGFSAPVEAGVPLAPPAFSTFDVGTADPGRAARSLRWVTAPGTFFFDWARYGRLNDLGLPELPFDDAEPSAGAFDLGPPPPLVPVGDFGAVVLRPETFRTQVANVDRSIVWRSEIRGPESGRRGLFPGAEGYGPVAAVKDAAGHIHVLTTDRRRRLLYARIDEDDTVNEQRDMLPAQNTSAVAQAIQTAAGNLLALTFDEDSGALRLVDFTDPALPIVRELADLCPGACPDVRFSGQVAVDGPTTHVAYQNPVTRTLSYDSFGAEAPVFAQIDANPGSGRDLRLFVTAGTPSIVMSETQAADVLRLVHLTFNRGWTRTVVRSDIGFPSLDTAAMLDARLVGATYHLVWTGRRPVNGFPIYQFMHSASYTVPAAIALPVVLSDGQCCGSDDAVVRSPSLLLRSNGQLLAWSAGVVPGYASVYVAQEQADDGIFASASPGNVVATDDRGPHLSAVLDAAGRARAYVRDGAFGVTEFTVTPRLAILGRSAFGTAGSVGNSAVTQVDSVSVAAGVLGGRVPAGATVLPPVVAVGRSQNKLYSVTTDDTVRTVENTAGRLVSHGTAVAARGVNTYALYVTSPDANTDRADLYLRQLNGLFPPAAANLATSTGFASVRNGGRNELRLVATRDATLHTAWYSVAGANAELVYWRRNNVDVVSTTVFRAVAFNGQPAIPPLLVARAGAQPAMKPNAIVTVDTPDGVQIVFASGNELHAVLPNAAPADLRSMRVYAADVTLLDAAVGQGGRLYVVYARGGGLYVAPWRGTPVEVAPVFRASHDTARLVTTNADETAVVVTESTVSPADLRQAARVLLYRPLQGEAPIEVLAPTDANDLTVASLSVVNDGTKGVDVFWGPQNVIPLETVGLVQRIRVRQHAPIVIHTRADGTRPLGSPGDRDEDGATDGTDVCPEVFDPAQRDTDRDGTGDACEAACP